MNVGPRAGRSIGLYLRHARSVRPYSSAAAEPTIENPTNVVPDPAVVPPVVATNDKPCKVLSGVVVSRPPLLTRDLTDFEESYYFYQRRLNQRLTLPFTRYFYFKQGTPADDEWKRKQKALEGRYTGFGERAWADELLVGDNQHKEEDFGYERLVKTTVSGEDNPDTEFGDAEEGRKAFQKPISRTTQADIENDRRSLNRKLTRTLYLLVKPKSKGKDKEKKEKKERKWRFPESQVMGRETLKDAAQRTLEQVAGVNMNTWFVGNVPIGHYVPRYAKGTLPNSKVFFMKARIMAGQADLSGNKFGYKDFMWLGKDEIEEFTDEYYWKAIRHMLVNQ